MMNGLNIRGRARDMLAAQNEPENLRILAEIFWRLLLFCMLLGVIAVIGYGSWEFFGVLGNLNSIDGTSVQPHAALDRVQLEGTVSGFQSRAQALQSSQADITSIPDPSK